MVTLIAVYNSDGCVGRCGARCYDAHEPDCDCICRGTNHGGGREQAVQNTREMAERWLDQARADGWAFDRHEIGQATAPTLLDCPTTDRIGRAGGED